MESKIVSFSGFFTFLVCFDDVCDLHVGIEMSISAEQLGDVIKVETTFGEQIIGELYCYEKANGLVVLNILISGLFVLNVSLIGREETREFG